MKIPGPAARQEAASAITGGGKSSRWQSSPGLRLPNLLSDAMVLQAGEPVRIWGRTRPGEAVCVRFAGQECRASADAEGRWEVFLAAMKPSAEGRDLTVEADSGRRVLGDVLVGQVWVCSGQSNMALPVSRMKNAGPLLERTDFPPIRAFNAPWNGDWQPCEDIRGSWRCLDHKALYWLSAVACVFALELHVRLGQPVGLLVSHVGGSSGGAWVERESLLEEPHLPRLHQIVHRAEAEHPRLADCGNAYFRKWHRDFRAYWRAFRRWRDKPEATRGPAPAVPAGVADKDAPSVLYNGMIAPLTRFTVRGVIWYQGEANAKTVELAREYRHLLAALIKGWRRAWGKPNLPFYFVQLPEFEGEQEKESWAFMRESMLRTWQQVPDTGMAVSIGHGDPKEIHPTDKIPVGQRLARIALAQAYGLKVAYSGPVFREARLEAGRVRLSFAHVCGGLRAAGDQLEGFELAAKDGPFYTACAKIEGEQVVAESECVEHPVYVRYAWHNLARPSLFNAEGLPASPFRTDDRLPFVQTESRAS